MAGGEWSEEFALRQLQDSTARILDNVGFTSSSADSLNILTDIMRQYMEQLCGKSKAYSEHANRSLYNVDDVDLAFKRLQVNGVELNEYMQQVGNLQDGPPPASSAASSSSFAPTPSASTAPQPPILPRFPARKPGGRVVTVSRPSEREVKEREEKWEHIPSHLPTLNPDWNGNEPFLADVHKPSTSSDSTSAVQEKKNTKPVDEFPSFFNMDALSLGIVKRAPPPPIPVVSRIDQASATGIKSSANAISKKLNKPHLKPANSLLTSVQCKSARASPLPPHTSSPTPPVHGGLHKRVESTPNLESIPKLSIPLSALRKEEKPVLSPSLTTANVKSEKERNTVKNNHLPEYDDIPVLEKSDPVESVASFNDNANMATPEYRLQDDLIKDETSQPPILISIRPPVDKKKEKKNKEKRKSKEKHKSKERPLSALPPLLEAASSISPLRTATPPMKLEPVEPAAVASTSNDLSSPPIRITIRGFHSDSPSSAFSPPEQLPRTPAADTPVSPPRGMDPSSSIPPPLSRADADSDSDTLPLFNGIPKQEDEEEEDSRLQTTFPLNMSMDSEGDRDKESRSPMKQKKKSKKKDKDRDRERRSDEKEGDKERRKEKEHKKKKKKEKDRDRDHDRSEQKKERDETSNIGIEKLPPLKIKLCSPPTSDPSATPQNPSPVERAEPVKINLKKMTVQPQEPSRVESPLPKLSLTISKKEMKDEKGVDKLRVKTKAELKAPPADFPPLFSVDTKIVRSATPNKEKSRKSNTSTPIPPSLSARNSPVPPISQLAVKVPKVEIEKEKTKSKEKEKSKNKDKGKLFKSVVMPVAAPPTPPPPFVPPVVVKEEGYGSKDAKGKKAEVKQSGKKPKKEKKSAEFILSAEDTTMEEGEKVWICPVCSVAYVDGANMVGCDVCDDWYHWTCVGLIVAPPDDVPWFCERCTKKKALLKTDKGDKRKSSSATGSSAKRKKH